MKTMRCVFLNRCYWPDSQATGQLLTDLCEGLADRMDVSVVVGQPVFHNGTEENFASSGVGVRNGVRIERLKHFQCSSPRVRYRIFNLLSFTLQVGKWFRTERPQCDVVVCETDPFFLPLVAARAARRSGCKLVFYLQDIYPDIAIALGVSKNNLAIRFLRSRLKAAYQQADRIVVLSDDMRDRLVQWGLDRHKIRIVPNWVDCQAIHPRRDHNHFRQQHQLKDRFVVMHSGNMGLTQHLDRLVSVMAHPDVPAHTTLALVGNGARRASLERRVKTEGPNCRIGKRVRFYDYQPRELLADSLSAADLHVVSMSESITGLMAPSKLYGILASGSPILAIVPKQCEVWRIVQQHKLGWCVQPGDADAVAAAIRQAAELPPEQLGQMGQRARSLAQRQYDQRTCIGQFEEMLREVVPAQADRDPVTSQARHVTDRHANDAMVIAD